MFYDSCIILRLILSTMAYHSKWISIDSVDNHPFVRSPIRRPNRNGITKRITSSDEKIYPCVSAVYFHVMSLVLLCSPGLLNANEAECYQEPFTNGCCPSWLRSFPARIWSRSFPARIWSKIRKSSDEWNKWSILYPRAEGSNGLVMVIQYYWMRLKLIILI